jgi:uncharacterized membrane protein YhhN
MHIIDSGVKGSMDSLISRAASPAARLVLYAAIAAGGSYLFVQNADLSDFLLLMWKGAGVWLLAVFALLMARNNDGWLLTGVLAFGALGDVLVEKDDVWGASAFAVAHIIAIALYWRNRRPNPAQSQLFLAYVLLLVVPVLCWLITHDAVTVIYAFILAAMAAAAWTSRFPRYRVGIGAIMFVASDLLIFARFGPLQSVTWPDYAIWALYFGGQVLITLGVTKILARSEQSSLS